MILPRIGSLKVVSNLNRFQRRLESPHTSHPICHSSESWNLPHHLSFPRIGNLQFVIPNTITSQSIHHSANAGISSSIPTDLSFQRIGNLQFVIPANAGTSHPICHPIKSDPAKAGTSHPICHPITIGSSESWNLLINTSFRECWNLPIYLTRFHSSESWNLPHHLSFRRIGNLQFVIQRICKLICLQHHGICLLL